MDPTPIPPTDDLDALLAAHALDALDGGDAAAVEALVAARPELRNRLARYRAAGAALAAVLPPPGGAGGPAVAGERSVPASLRHAAFAARPARRPLRGPSRPATAAEVHAGRAAALAALVTDLAPAEWAAPTRLGPSVQEVLAHLLGRLARVADELEAAAAGAPRPASYDAAYDHWGATAPWVERFGRGDPAPLVAELRRVDARVVGAAAAAAGDAADLGSPVARALTLSFESWMHADDARLAVGRPVEVPAAATLAALCTLAADAVPVTLALTGASVPGAVARLVLTGPGGGVWLRPLAPGGAVAPDAPGDVTIVAEAHTFCRLFHAQVDPAGALRAVEGDPALARAVVAAAGALAERT